MLSVKVSWNTRAAPKSSDGKHNYYSALTGDDLHEFVNFKMVSYHKQFKLSAENANTLEYKIG